MDIPLSDIKGIGQARLKTLKAQGIDSVRDLLLCLPADYKDLSQPKQLSELFAGDVACVKVRVDAPVREQRVKRLVITKTRVADDSESMPVIWYNQPWLKGQLFEGKELLLYGRVEAKYGHLQLSSPTIEHETGLIPIYRRMQGIPPKTFRQMIEIALKQAEGQWPDELPASLRARYGLCERNFAMRAAHFPESHEALAAARYRLAFEELLLYQAGLWMMRGTGQKGVAIASTKKDEDAFWKTMPFPPTAAQTRVLREILADMRSELAMARLVQGDVGSGKTALAFGALYVAAKKGYMGAMMAPTEILARQHYESAKQLLEPQGIRCGLLIGSMTPKQKKEAHLAIQNGDWQVAIGTHALISKGVEYKNLGLVVTDEQHRFGVKQRTTLSEKGDSPNVLVMSATPIPRTLALILYGDLDVSIVDELPPGRTPVKTRVVPESKRDGMYGFIIQEVQAGRQVYVVCPLVEESEAVEARPAEAVYEDLRTGPLKSLRVGLVHGRMKSIEKEEMLSQFHQGDLDVLVSTTVIEVGVNVPNASVMVIENAERFGLAQLHQLRGRVGRGANVSWCFLMANENEKLDLMTKTNDGFVIAQKDMELRGPGELFGYRQSGAMAAGIGKLMGDTKLLQQTHDEVKRLMKHPDDPESIQVMAAAKTLFDERTQDIAMN
ncbi:ATP-dependent DNA helicase RecG [Eubacteriales bacterium OttesenSCG-928-N13]|nr:ATP-dependent DNA helicase RecG [Eubacteriales bacterium OttesenSCG-928-N13]